MPGATYRGQYHRDAESTGGLCIGNEDDDHATGNGVSPVLSSTIEPLDDFEAFYRAQYPKLAGSLRVVSGDVGLAEELAQEAFARALLHWERLRHYEKPAGWLYRTAFNLLRRHWSKARRDEGPLVHDISTSPGDDTRIDVTRALAALPYRQRQAVVLRHILDYPTEEVAVMMEVAPGALRMTLHRAVATLREQYQIVLADEEDGR